MGTIERRAREKMLLREEILDAARELFVKHGYENVSMRKIAGKIEYSPTTIYLYFKDKAEILQTLCDETFGRLFRILNEIAIRPGDPVEKLRDIGRAYVKFGLAHPNHYRVTFMTNFDGAKKSSEDFAADPGMQTFQCLCNCVQECVELASFRKIDVLTASQTLWCGVHGVTSLLISMCGFPFVEKDQLINATVDTMIEGLREPQSRPLNRQLNRRTPK